MLVKGTHFIFTVYFCEDNYPSSVLFQTGKSLCYTLCGEWNCQQVQCGCALVMNKINRFEWCASGLWSGDMAIL